MSATTGGEEKMSYLHNLIVSLSLHCNCLGFLYTRTNI